MTSDKPRYQFNLKSGENIFLNYEAKQLLGRDQDFFDKKGKQALKRIFHPDDFHKIAEHHNQCRALAPGEEREIRYRVWGANGECLYIKGVDRCSEAKDGVCQALDGVLEQISAENFHLYYRLRTALEDEELILWYQPIVDLKTGAVLGQEALARWVLSPDRFISPARFIPVLEGSDLEDLWVETQLLQLAYEIESLPGDFVSYNLTIPYLAQTQKVLHALGQHKWEKGSVWIEVPEYGLLEDSVVETLWALRNAGYPIKADDFPRGSDPFARILLNENGLIQGIKLDMIVVTGCDSSRQKQAFIQATVGLSESKEFSIVAEGIATEAERDTLLSLGVEMGQGELFGMAVPFRGMAA